MDRQHGPIAGRLKRPGWSDPRLLIGLALIVASVIGVASVVSSADQTTPHYAARDILTPGQVITMDDLVVVGVRVSSGEYVAEGEPIEGMVATRVIGPGELVPVAALDDSAAHGLRPVAVVVDLPLAHNVERGTVVDIWITTTGEHQSQSSRIAQSVVVEDVDREHGAFSSSGAETVYVLVAERDVASILEALAGDGDVAVVRVGGGV